MSVTDADLREAMPWYEARDKKLREIEKREPLVEDVIRLTQEYDAACEGDRVTKAALDAAVELAAACRRLTEWRP